MRQLTPDVLILIGFVAGVGVSLLLRIVTERWYERAEKRS